MAFTQVPILDLGEARDPSTKPAFLSKLRDAVLRVGFLYLSNTGIDQEFYDQVCEQGIKFFNLPEDEKLSIEMKRSPAFLGYSKLGNETTAQAADWREQLDLSTPHALREQGDPLYYNMFGPNQWPNNPKLLPQFREIMEEYMRLMTDLSVFLTKLLAESLDLESKAFDRFFDEDQQHKLKIIKYPDYGEGIGQGVGPHKDSMLSSYLLQASGHRGLQVLNLKGEWIDCPPIRGTLVVNIGQGMEAITDGVCKATVHRVLSPQPGSGPRFSIPFFQGVSYDAVFESMNVPEHLHELARKIRGKEGGYKEDKVEFTFVKGKWKHLGEATLMNRIKSHPDVGEKWYPELLEEIRREQNGA